MMEAVQSVLGAPVADDTPLMDAGLDSLGAVEFKNAVESLVGVELPVTVAFDYPCVAALCGYIVAHSLPAPPISADVTLAGPLPLRLYVPTKTWPSLVFAS